MLANDTYAEQQRKEKEIHRLSLELVKEELEKYSVDQPLATEADMKQFFDSFVERYSIHKLWDDISKEVGRLQSKKKDVRPPLLRLIIVKILGISMEGPMGGVNLSFQIICYDYLSKNIQINNYHIESVVGGWGRVSETSPYRIWLMNQRERGAGLIKFINFTALLGDYLDNESTPSPFATTLVAVPKDSLQTIISTISNLYLDMYIPGANQLRGGGKINKAGILKKLNKQLEWCRSINQLNVPYVSGIADELSQKFTTPEIYSLISEYLGEVVQSAKEGYEENQFALAPSKPFLTMLYKQSLVSQPSAAPLFSTASSSSANTATVAASTHITPAISLTASTSAASSSSSSSLLVLVASNTGAMAVVDANKPTTITAVASDDSGSGAFAAVKRKKKRQKK